MRGRSSGFIGSRWRFSMAISRLPAKRGFLPASKEDLKLLLDLYVLQKAIYELTYELNNRPDWVNVPLRGIIEILQPTS